MSNYKFQENTSFGFVKLYRSIANKAWYKKSQHAHLFIHLLLRATHAGYEILFNGRSVKLLPGQLVTGRKQLKSETGIDEYKIERILKLFEREQQIAQQTTNTSRLITILNWDIYQKGEQQIAQQLHNEHTTGAQQLHTIQECYKNDKNVKEEACDLNFSVEQFWDLYDKKVGSISKLQITWRNLTDEERQAIMDFIPKYKLTKTDKNYRKNPETFLKDRSWLDELPGYRETKKYDWDKNNKW